VTKCMLIIVALLLPTAANAEPLPKPRPKIGSVCPSGWSVSPTSGYCVPGPNNKCRMMPKLGAPCPPGWSASFDYCVETNCQSR
jgi:hypothetical protein